MEPAPRAEYGPLTWRIIHLFAIAYPDDPTPEEQEKARRFYTALADFLPCEECQEHFAVVLANLPVANALENKKTLFDWTVDAHNMVNRRLGKRELTRQEAYKLYATEQSRHAIGGPWQQSTPTVQPTSTTEPAAAAAAAAPKTKQTRKPLAPLTLRRSAPLKSVQRPATSNGRNNNNARTVAVAGEGPVRNRIVKIPPPRPVGWRSTSGCPNCR